MLTAPLLLRFPKSTHFATPLSSPKILHKPTNLLTLPSTNLPGFPCFYEQMMINTVGAVRCRQTVKPTFRSMFVRRPRYENY